MDGVAASDPSWFKPMPLSLPPPMTDLQRHDARYHKRGFDPNRDVCLYRQRLEEKKDNDDILDPENVPGEEDEIKRHKSESRKIAKERRQAARKAEYERRSAEINEKTIAALDREYTDEECAMAEQGLRYALYGKPAISVDTEKVVEKTRILQKMPKTEQIDQVLMMFNAFGNEFSVCGLGEVKIDKQSAKSIVSHTREGLKMPQIAALLYIPEIGKRSMLFAHNPKWKDRSYDTLSFCCPIEIANTPRIVEFTIERHSSGLSRLYTIKVVGKEKVDGVQPLPSQRDLQFETGKITPHQQLPLYQNLIQGVNGESEEKVEGVYPLSSQETCSLRPGKTTPPQPQSLYQKLVSEVNAESGRNADAAASGSQAAMPTQGPSARQPSQQQTASQGQAPNITSPMTKEQFAEAMRTPSLLAKQVLATRYSRMKRARPNAAIPDLTKFLTRPQA